MTETGVNVFARDPESSKQVWSQKEGYPGDYEYREFYRDLGYDADWDYLKPYMHSDGQRRGLGIKYHRITGDVDLGEKGFYDPIKASGKAAEHAGNFLFNRSMKPLIIYVDDEPHNLAVFEASLSSDWDIKTFSNPLEALNALPNLKPWVIVSDQRMPDTTGMQYLELARKLHPEAIRIIVTGYSQEELVIESVRKAHVFDYIKKPWEPEDLENSLNRAIQLYQLNQEAKKLQEELKNREQQLSTQNIKLQESNERELQLRAELECWAPPFLLNFIQKEKNNFPLKKDLVGLTFDIVNSNQIHNKTVSGKPLRSAVLKAFTEAVFKAGGRQESQNLWRSFANPVVQVALARGLSAGGACAESSVLYLYRIVGRTWTAVVTPHRTQRRMPAPRRLVVPSLDAPRHCLRVPCQCCRTSRSQHAACLWARRRTDRRGGCCCLDLLPYRTSLLLPPQVNAWILILLEDQLQALRLWVDVEDEDHGNSDAWRHLLVAR
jgi:FixJ family two-component response regulator